MQYFLKDLLTAIESLAKSVLVDAYCVRYRHSIVAAGIVSAAFELTLLKMLDEHKRFAERPELVDDRTNFPVPVLDHLRRLSRVWENIVQHVFGSQALE